MSVSMLSTFVKPMHREGRKFVAIFAGIAVLAVEAGGKDIESRTKSAQDGSFRLRVPPDSLWDLRYGEAFESRDVPLLEVRAETARTFKAVRAGTAEVSLEWR